MDAVLGTRLRAFRKESGLTLSEIASSIDLSVAYLSNIERGKASPTIANLHRICALLGITLNDLLGSEGSVAQESSYAVPRGARPAIFSQEGLSYDSLTMGDSSLKATAMTLTSTDWVHFSAHDHDELGIIASGQLEMNVGGKTYLLRTGDSIFIHEGTMHSARLSGSEESVSYWIKQGRQDQR